MRRIVWALAVLVVVLLVAAVWTAIAQPAVGRTIWSFVHDYRWWGVPAAVIAVAVLLLWPLRRLLRLPWGSSWRVHILATADEFHYQLEALPPARRQAERDLRRSVEKAIEHHLEPPAKPPGPASSSGSP